LKTERETPIILKNREGESTMQIQRQGSPKEEALRGMGTSFIQRGFNPQVLTEQISRVLTEAILDGAIEPGTRLLEMELQQQLGVSRSPLREAFRHLEKKGLVVILPRRGAFVKEITTRDVQENFPVRGNLEGLAARLAHGKLSQQDLVKMRGALEGMNRAGRTQDREAYRQNHQIFHDVFIEASDNRLLIDILQNLRMHRLWYFVSYRYQKLDFQMAIDVHEKILELFEREKADPHELELLVRRHIDEALGLLFGAVDTPGPGRPKSGAKGKASPGKRKRSQ
jgi:DNA-binding GntR family transcriptional regulator